MAENNTRSFVVDIIDERDELVGYGVCAWTQIDGRWTFQMHPEVYGVRSEAHAAIAPVEVIETSAPLVCDAELVGDRITVTFKSPARGARMVPMLELAQFIVLELAGKHPDVREIVARDSSGEQLQSYEREEEASYR
jgi:hypothetical protein